MTSSARRRWVFGLLLPHALSVSAFVGSMIVVYVEQSNRTLLDLNLGVGGFVCGGLALIASMVALFLTPWRQMLGWDAVALTFHAAGVVATLALASGWMGAHIA